MCASVADAANTTTTTAANKTAAATTVPAAQVTTIVTTAVATTPQPTPTKAGTLPSVDIATVRVTGIFAMKART